MVLQMQGSLYKTASNKAHKSQVHEETRHSWLTYNGRRHPVFEYQKNMCEVTTLE